MENSLWEHQKAGIELFKQTGSYGFFFDVGTGKTRTAIECLRHVYNHYGKLVPTWIISPLITLENWKREIMKYSKIKEEDIYIFHGSPARKRKLLEYLKKNPNKIVIVNWQGMLSKEVVNYLLANPPKVLVGDELHYIKNPASKTTKNTLSISPLATHKIGLTGTPVLNSSQDLWSQIFFLDNGKRLGNKFHWFKIKYFYDKNASMPKHIHFPNWAPVPGSNVEIKNLISTITMSVKKEDCLNLPPLVRETLYTEMSAEQEKHYEAMKEDFISYVNDDACVATLAITKALRMQQILSGFMQLESGETVVFKDVPRLKTLEELLELVTPHHKVLVWANFKQNHKDISKLCEKLGIKHVFLTGEQTKKEKDETMEAFENDPEVRVCIGNQSVGIGVNMVASSISVYYSKGFNLGHDIQSEARNHRAGSEIHTSITRYDLVIPDTLDEHVNEALADKKEIGAQLLKKFSVAL